MKQSNLYDTPRGRYPGTNIMVHADKEYHLTWFGDGEVKIYLDRPVL